MLSFSPTLSFLLVVASFIHGVVSDESCVQHTGNPLAYSVATGPYGYCACAPYSNPDDEIGRCFGPTTPDHAKTGCNYYPANGDLTAAGEGAQCTLVCDPGLWLRRRIPGELAAFYVMWSTHISCLLTSYFRDPRFRRPNGIVTTVNATTGVPPDNPKALPDLPTAIPARKRKRDLEVAEQIRRNQIKRAATQQLPIPASLNKALCTNALTACKIPRTLSPSSPSTELQFECVDTKWDLRHCGGCVSGFNDEGIDCESLDGAVRVACVSGKCQIGKCAKGYHLMKNLGGKSTFCIRDTTH
ncbi:hypothetical protein FRB95_011712 [Tulasnella sp. JGI-2019a]|nr:hypothetical protein FRB95_011712 [Tulasnella sp. JGI-2019a]